MSEINRKMNKIKTKKSHGKACVRQCLIALTGNVVRFQFIFLSKQIRD